MLTIYGNVAGGQATAALSGVGVAAAAIVLSPITVTYSGTNVGSASAAQNITISNTGGVTATLRAPAVTRGFCDYGEYVRDDAGGECGMHGGGCVPADGFGDADGQLER